MKTQNLLFLLIFLFSIHMQSQIENSIFAVYKLSYNELSENHNVSKGIIGTAFLWDKETALTARHVLDPDSFKPDKGFKNVQFWLLSRDGITVIPIEKEFIEPVIGCDVTIIALPIKLEFTLDLPMIGFRIGSEIHSFGHKGGQPVTSTHVEDSLFVIDTFDLSCCKADRKGTLVDDPYLQMIKVDNNIVEEVFLARPSFELDHGMSGGPILMENEIVGLMSFYIKNTNTDENIGYAILIYSMGHKFRETNWFRENRTGIH